MFTIEHGTTRMVIVYKSIAIKIPRIRIIKILRDLRSIIRRKHYDRLRNYFSYPVYVKSLPGFKNNAFNGIVSNWNEFLFWRKTKNKFCEPTYFSLIGLINVQRASPSIDEYSKDEFWYKLRNTEGYDFADRHHFSNPKNFAIRNGRLLIRDYAYGETQEVVLEFGEKMQKHFS